MLKNNLFMKTLGHLLTFLIIVYLAVMITSACDKEYIHLSDDFKGGIILEKSEDFTFGYTVSILKKDGTIKDVIRVYGIEYNHYKLGDTIK